MGFLFLGIVAGVGAYAGNLLLFAFSPAVSGSQVSATVEIHKGESPSEIARGLLASGAIVDGKKFMWVGRIFRQWKGIKAGEYAVSPNLTPLEIFKIFKSGVSIIHSVTVREGENMYEIAAELQNQNLSTQEKVLALCKNPQFIASQGLTQPLPPTLEGYLFPDTYFFNRTMSTEDILKQMVRHFKEIWRENEEARAKALNLTQLQAVTLASIIEKETGAPQERPMISSIFHNRLRKRMRLQSDPTTIYGMWERYEGKIHRSDLLAENAYNTYAIPALPVGPISNPGREAIQAALNPVESEYLYFVSHNDGTHQFSKSLDDHNAAVRKFQLDPKAREGKSWRDLSKKQVPQKR